MDEQGVPSSVYTIKNFLPLIIIVLIIVGLTAFLQLFHGWGIHEIMYDFMGLFFVVFSLFKIINIRKFAEAYSMYDIIAKRSWLYAYLYPFIELTLGIMYLTRFQLFFANLITFVLMVIGSIGVGYELYQQKEIVCACLGAVFKIPMTYVTLAEDLIMGAMALYMIFMA
jgi:hypothetical protein